MLFYLCTFVSIADDIPADVPETFGLWYLLQFRYKLLANVGYSESQNRKRFSNIRSYLCIRFEATLAHMVS